MNRQALIAHLAIEVTTLDVWLEQEWLVPARTETDLHFSAADVARARFIRDLKADMGVNDPGIDVILHLLDQLHGFRRAFEGLHDDLPARHDGDSGR